MIGWFYGWLYYVNSVAYVTLSYRRYTMVVCWV